MPPFVEEAFHGCCGIHSGDSSLPTVYSSISFVLHVTCCCTLASVMSMVVNGLLSQRISPVMHVCTGLS